MGASTGNMLVDNPETLDAIFREAPTPIITHCEDTPMIDAELARYKAKYGDDIPAEFHADIRSREACKKSTMLAMELARRNDSRLHVLHISTADELALFERGPLIRGDGSRKRITAETCIHFLRFDRADYAKLGNFIKVQPVDQGGQRPRGLIAALGDDVIDVLATDHAPHTLEEKMRPYTSAPSGLPLVQYALVAALELVHEGRLTNAQVVQKVSHAPAQLFDVSAARLPARGLHGRPGADRRHAVHRAPRGRAVEVRLVAVRRTHLPFAHRGDLGEWRAGVGWRAARGHAGRTAAGVRALMTGAGHPCARRDPWRRRWPWIPACAGMTMLMAACSATPVAVIRHAPTDPGASVASTRGTVLPKDVEQGALVIGSTSPGAKVEFAGRQVRVSPEGIFVVGIGRDAASPALVAITQASTGRVEYPITVRPRDFPVERVTGVPPQTVRPPPDIAARIEREQAQVSAARTRDDARIDFEHAFIWPVEGRISGRFGNRRTYVLPDGTEDPQTPHSGMDIAAPAGTPVRAPAGGIVTFANPDLYSPAARCCSTTATVSVPTSCTSRASTCTWAIASNKARSSAPSARRDAQAGRTCTGA
jgi:hypothetical protein